MCGRFTLHADEDALLDTFDLDELPAGYRLEPAYNIAPSQELAIIRRAADGRALSTARWGLVPSWSKVPRTRYSTINARLETAADKPAYKAAFRRRHCLVPADGFYEWHRTAAGKTPWHIALPDSRLFAFAGLWERWEGADEAFDSCTLLTRPARRVMGKIHEREPVILATADQYARWLAVEDHHAGAIQAWLTALPEPSLEAWPVSTFVNSPANNTTRCLEPIEANS